MRRLLFGIAVIGCALIGPAVGYASWGAPVQIASSRVSGWFSPGPPEVATDAQGDGVVVWHREDVSGDSLAAVEASTQRGGAAWSAPVRLSSPSNGYAFAPEVLMGSQGEVVVTWEHAREIVARRGSQTGSWGRLVRLSSSSEEAGGDDLVGDSRGDAGVVFDGSVGYKASVKFRVGRVSHGWSPPRTVASGRSVSLSEPQVGTDSRGEAIVAWVASSGSDEGDWVQAVILGSTGRPEGSVQTLSSRRGHSRELRLVANEAGNAVLVWRQAGVKRRPIEVATRQLGGRFSGAVTVSRGEDVEPRVAIEPNGDAAILFTRILSTQPGVQEPEEPFIPAITQTSAVEVVSRQGRGSWTRPAPVASAAVGGSTFAPQIASASGGNVMMAVWAHSHFRGTEVVYNGSIEAATISPGRSSQAPVTISSGESYGPSIAVSSNGEATAAWGARYEPVKSISPELGLRIESLQVAEYKTAP